LKGETRGRPDACLWSADPDLEKGKRENKKRGDLRGQSDKLIRLVGAGHSGARCFSYKEEREKGVPWEGGGVA